jgi:hypothetical protein
MELNEAAVEVCCLDIAEKTVIRVTDEQAVALIRKVSKCENVAMFQNLDSNKRNNYLKRLREKGVSIRQLSRLTGISIGVIRKIS